MNPAPPVTSAFTPAVLVGHPERRPARSRPRCRTSSPMTVSRSSAGAGPDHGPGPDDGAVDHGPAADLRPRQQHGVAHHRARLDVAAAHQHGVRRPPRRRPTTADVDDRRLGGAPVPVDQVELGLQVGGGRAGVDPVGVGVHGEQAAVAHHLREGGPLDRHPAPGRDPLQHRRLEHVGAGVDPVGRGLARRRLLDERLDPPVVVDGHHAVARRIVHRGQGDRALGPAARGGSPTGRRRRGR